MRRARVFWTKFLRTTEHRKIKNFFEFDFEKFTYFLRILENNEVRRTSKSFFGVFDNHLPPAGRMICDLQQRLSVFCLAKIL